MPVKQPNVVTWPRTGSAYDVIEFCEDDFSW
jgi:hypothetical protein